MIKTSLVVIRYDWTTYDHFAPKGSGYCKDQGTYQLLIKKYWLFGWCFLSIEVDREVVPSNEAIALACFGHSPWKSKFAKYIKAQNEAKK